jgi:hypothetical protein
MGSGIRARIGLGLDPFIYDPSRGGGLWLGYGYFDYPNNYIDPGLGYYGPDYNSVPPAQRSPSMADPVPTQELHAIPQPEATT